MNQAAVSVSPNADNSVERFRPNPWGWMWVGTLGLCAWFMGNLVWYPIFGARHLHSAFIGPFSYVMTSIAGAFFLGVVFFTVALAVRLMRSEIRIERESVSWDTWRGTHTIPWSEVVDYYEVDKVGLHRLDAGPKRKQVIGTTIGVPHAYLVKTTQGNFGFSHPWPRSGDLQARIAERALNARATAWGVLGARPELDLPKTFGYDTVSSRWGIAVTRLVCYVLMLASFAYFGPMAWRGATNVAALMGWGWGILPLVGLSVLIFYIFGVLLLAYPGFGELRRRWTQTITLSQDGLLYRGNTQTIEARWEEITRLTIDGMEQTASVETIHGSFDFRAIIRDYWILKSAIEAMSADAVPAGWQLKGKERLDRTTQKASGIQPLTQSELYSYRTRTNLGLLLLGTVNFGGFSVIMGSLYLSEVHNFKTFIAMIHDMGTMGALSIGVNTYLLIGFIFTAWSWRSYFVAGIKTDDEGITQITIKGPKRILWADVMDVKSIGAEAFTWVSVSSPTQRIWFSPLIADSKELLAEIKRRTQKEPEIS